LRLATSLSVGGVGWESDGAAGKARAICGWRRATIGRRGGVGVGRRGAAGNAQSNLRLATSNYLPEGRDMGGAAR